MGTGQKINCCEGNALARGDNLRCGTVDAVQKIWPPGWLKYAHMTIQPENLQNP
ncbi:hypothetical protein ABSU46_003451 [Salmonella enterica subsp. enterica serovar Typhimurium]|nr:hypothetical protein [Salmonella enterica]EAM2293884.1 hypothetical protein [Salmonella enterica]EBH2976091.1 hypothetical protein [Salmonella enterica subsp. enterica serovar Typhimurium]EBX3815920.1 hypothetical protein [Salmonella enterica subsp. enterica serovar Typhimurium]EBY3787299.1 hypothetical protein [Salmonella enterica subsp. enterica serovar Typhimurium]EBY9890764.1 hypothetical protein [Salmonella enterica subsp. enterica serovar Typhimurium]